MPAEINAIAQLTLAAGLQPGFGPPWWPCGTWAPWHMCWGVLVLLPCPGSLWHPQGKGFAFGSVGPRGPAGQEMVPFSQQLCYSLSFALNHWHLLPSLELPGFDLESLDLVL